MFSRKKEFNIKQILKNVQTGCELRSQEILLGYVLKKSRAYLYTHPERILNLEEIILFEHLITRYQQGEPIAYLVGEKEFYSLDFKVTRDTLIPRPETEILVDEALQLMPSEEECSVLELGTGSGAIAVTLASLRPKWHILATDISSPALAVAKENAQFHQVNHINFLLSNWFDSIPAQKFNLIISNPPYIAAQDPHLQDLRYEPLSALQAGEQGLDDLEKIIKKAPDYLLPNGWLLLEHGFDQKEKVEQLLAKQHFQAINTVLDLAALPRVTMARLGPH